MENKSASTRRRFQDQVFVWDKKFATRQQTAHSAEDRILKPEDDETAITAFMNKFGSRLDPPQYSHVALRAFLEKAVDGSRDPENDLKTDPTPAPHDQLLILLDDRRDDTGWQDASGERHWARDWTGYAEYPPQGEGQEFLMLDAGELYRKQLRSVDAPNASLKLASTH